LRHTIAVVAYRAEKVLRDAPTGFGEFRAGPRSRRAGQILAHMGDLYDWAWWLSQGQHIWNDATPMPWEAEVVRFFSALRRFDDYVESVEVLKCSEERLIQGPIADSLTHIGQLAMLRALAGAPVRGENYFKADIALGRIGREQSVDRVEFD
jgi:hypothetical protein